MCKEMWIAAHEQLVEEYMAEHPDADEKEVYDRMADFASDRMADNLAGMMDAVRDRMKYGE